MDDGGLPAGNELHRGDQRDTEMSVNAPIEEVSAPDPPNPRLSRRRTKTGCLTCRRRRIKCGEERPTCANCIKSKRQCEGYNQRVVFKDPLNMYRGPTSSMATHSGFVARPIPQQVLSDPYGPFVPAEVPPQTLLPNILPRATRTFQTEVSGNTLPTTQFQAFVYNDPTTFQPQQHIGNPLGREPDLDPEGPHKQTPAQWQNRMNPEPILYPLNSQRSGASPLAEYQHDFKYAEMYSAQTNRSHHPNSINAPLQIPPSAGGEIVSLNSSSGIHGGQERRGYEEQHNTIMYSTKRIGEEDQSRDENSTQKGARGHVTWALPSPHEPLATGSIYPNESYSMPNQPQEAVKEENEDDNNDPYDVSDEDMDMSDLEDGVDTQSRSRQRRLRDDNLSIVMAAQAVQNREDTRIRTYHSVIESFGSDMLANYYPSSRDSPLSNPVTASIFCHFVNVIAPSISLYERHPPNPSVVFQGNPVPKSQQHIWSYTMPTIALRNHALLHAMLAMASLHIAKLQNGPIAASLKHYHIAIRKLAKNVGLPTRRRQLATLATTLLLGYYEVISADHSKWCDHLLGAQQLIKQIDFAGMTRYLKTRKGRVEQARPGHLYHHSMALGVTPDYQDEAMGGFEHSVEDEVDENLVGILMGKKLKYAEYGEVFEDADEPYNGNRKYTQRDLEIFDTQRDLFWWYLKQDAIQSILSQNRLFLNYERWSHCPPRAPVGRRDAVHGTFDHLILLLGRLSEFAAKDLKRKRRFIQANGGQWRPSPGMQMPGPPPNTSGGAPPRAPNPNFDGGPKHEGPRIPMVPPGPLFAGMLPNTNKASLPRGFSPASDDSPPPNSEDDDTRLDDQTAEAMEEWDDILNAFRILGERLGPDFAPLGPEYVQEINSPFGPAIQYRTYSIAVIWLLYYMGLIVCHRAHPSMPPTAMVAAGFAARETAMFANKIGRISAGVAPDASTATHVNIGTGTGLTESAFALFVAGVQLQDPTQRAWLIRRMLDIERLTGWETASQVAKGCETSWVRAAELGKGPPYTRYQEPIPVDRIWNRAGQRMNRMWISVGEETHINRQGTALTGRVQWAIGLIGIEGNLARLNLESDDEDELIDSSRDEQSQHRLSKIQRCLT